MQDMRRALRGSYRPKSPHPQRLDSQSRQNIMVANYIGDGKPLPPTPGTSEEEWGLFAKKIGSVFLAASIVRNIVGESDVIRIDKSYCLNNGKREEGEDVK